MDKINLFLTGGFINIINSQALVGIILWNITIPIVNYIFIFTQDPGWELLANYITIIISLLEMYTSFVWVFNKNAHFYSIWQLAGLTTYWSTNNTGGFTTLVPETGAMIVLLHNCIVMDLNSSNHEARLQKTWIIFMVETDFFSPEAMESHKIITKYTTPKAPRNSLPAA